MAAEPLPAGVSQDLFDELVRAILDWLTSSAASLDLGSSFNWDSFSTASTAWAEHRAGELIRDLASTDQQILASALDMARSDGWSQAKLRDFLSKGSYDPNRVAMIARTERGFADNAGSVLGWEANGTKYFIVLDSPGCRPIGHFDESIEPNREPGIVQEDRDAHGQVWTAEQCMKLLLSHPHCERAFRPATQAELEELGLAA